MSSTIVKYQTWILQQMLLIGLEWYAIIDTKGSIISNLGADLPQCTFKYLLYVMFWHYYFYLLYSHYTINVFHTYNYFSFLLKATVSQDFDPFFMIINHLELVLIFVYAPKTEDQRCQRHCGVKHSGVIGTAESSTAVSLAQLSQAQRCLWHCWVTICSVNDTLDSKRFSIISQKCGRQFKEALSLNFLKLFVS